MSLLSELIIRIVLVIVINDGVIFYVLNRRSQIITMRLGAAIILITIIVLLINILFCLHRRGIV